jgi:DNA-binding response OmpR family regulator
MTDPKAAGSVLIVEDDPDIRALLEQRAQKLGHSTVTVGTAEAALAACTTNVPSLVLLDLKLPGMDGWGFLERLRSDSRQAGVPVVVVSIVDEGEPHPQVDDYLTKPFRTAAVDAILRRYLQPEGDHP